jgi:His-Xaa-Ser system protein HxsD
MAGEGSPLGRLAVPQPELQLPAGVATRFEDGALRVTLSIDVYALQAILRSCYWLTDRCFLYLAPPKDGLIEITLLSKSGDSTQTDQLTWDFLNDLIDQQLRISINAETQAIREVIVAQAFADVDLIDDRGCPISSDESQEDQVDADPDGIKKWRPAS